MRNDSFAIVWARTTQNRKTGEVEYDRGGSMFGKAWRHDKATAGNQVKWHCFMEALCFEVE